jgi:hypothetical protein
MSATGLRYRRNQDLVDLCYDHRYSPDACASCGLDFVWPPGVDDGTDPDVITFACQDCEATTTLRRIRPAYLTNPDPDTVARLCLVNLDRFNDHDITCGDFGTWTELYTNYTEPDQRERLDRLVALMPRHGALGHLQITQYTDRLALSNGHHRVWAAREIGFTHLPYQWYHRSNTPSYRWAGVTGPLPELVRSTALCDR